MVTLYDYYINSVHLHVDSKYYCHFEREMGAIFMRKPVFVTSENQRVRYLISTSFFVCLVKQDKSSFFICNLEKMTS